ncbi:helix-turn-helix domain-containing protein [Clostridium sp. Marseille-P2415]|uniref:helix-turn-helix domain-containing protein n=1 Tax=Clostridium sp. Marseille-P2415 TaxID=1805471 RepID=UPI0009883E38|nr:helix-turn-helix domain-containing protein [Clostridium sp. Marseille-P2415]
MVKTYEPLYTVKEVSKILKTNTDAVYALIKQGQLPCLLLGSKKIRGSDLERFIEQYPAVPLKPEEESHAEVL